jgi:hypothetical protein
MCVYYRPSGVIEEAVHPAPLRPRHASQPRSHVPARRPATAQEQRPAAQRSRSDTKEENRGHAHASGRIQHSASAPAVNSTKKTLNANAPPVRRNHAADSHYTTPTRLAPALPPIPGSEASAPPTPTPSYRDFVPSRSPPQSLNAVVEHMARTPPSKSPGNASGEWRE